MGRRLSAKARAELRQKWHQMIVEEAWLPSVYRDMRRFEQRLSKLSEASEVILELITKKLRLMKSDLLEDKSDELSVKELMQFYVDMSNASNDGYEIVRQFLIYFPVELDTDSREMVILFKKLEKPVKKRVIKFLGRVIEKQEEFPSTATEYRRKVVEVCREEVL